MIGALGSTLHAARRVASIFLLLGFGLVLAFSQVIPVQLRPTNLVPAVTLLEQAESFTAARQFDRAKTIYQFLIDRGDTTDVPLIGLGNVAMAEESWTDAVDWFEKAVKLAPDDLDARYHLGRAHGERGRSMFVLEKLFSFLPSTNFKEAENDFRWVLSRDSTYKDALYQFALVYRYKREYPEAIALALKQIEVKPQLRHGHLGLFRIYRESVGRPEQPTPPDQLIHPKNDYDRYFIAEWQRRHGQLEKAESGFKALLDNPGIVRTPLIWESLARIEAGKGNDEDAERCFANAVDSIRTMGDADLVFEDIKYIITDDELHRYRSLADVSEAKKFFSEFWPKRNPYPAMKVNVRIGEHFRRLVYAEAYFQQFDRKTFSHGAGDTFLLNFPESYYLNEEFNDKGVIYLHHGEPDRKIVTGSVPSNEMNSGGAASANESWLYLATDESPEMLFDFYVPQGAHATEWRLVPVLSDVTLWNDRAAFSHKYSRLQYAPRDPTAMKFGLPEAGREKALIESTEEGKRTVYSGVTSERHSFEKKTKYFESPISVTCYRGSRGKTLVDVGYVISRGEMAHEIPDSIGTLNVNATYAMYNPSWMKATSGQRSRSYERTGEKGSSVIEMFQTTVVPDSYVVAWEAKLEGADLVISQKVKAEIRAFSGASLNMSDIELAYAIEPAKEGGEFNRGSLSVIPNPLRRSPLNLPLHVYFEAYNLTKNWDGKTSYTVEYGLAEAGSGKSFLAGIFGGKKKTITVQSERSGRVDWSPERIDIDVSKLEAGKYELRVKLTDNPTKTSVSRSLGLELFKQE